MNDTERQQVVDALAAANPLYYEDAADALAPVVDRIANQRAAGALREAAEGFDAEARRHDDAEPISTDGLSRMIAAARSCRYAARVLRDRADALTDKATP